MSASFDFDEDEAYREIMAKARTDAELLEKSRESAGDVKDYAVSISPVESGEYAGAWHVEDTVRRVDGMPVHRVTNDDPKAEMIEDGTGQYNPRSQGGSSPEHAIRAKTAAHFAGTEELVTPD